MYHTSHRRPPSRRAAPARHRLSPASSSSSSASSSKKDLAASMPIVDNTPPATSSLPSGSPNCPLPLPDHGQTVNSPPPQSTSSAVDPPSSVGLRSPSAAGPAALSLLQWPLSPTPSAPAVHATSGSLSAAASRPSDSSFPTLFSLDTIRSRLRQLHQRPSTPQSTPVLVTAYSGPRPSPFRFASRAAMSMSGPVSSLPPVSNFSFSHILLTIDSQIQDPLEAISEICARSRLSLADEYNAHLPPQGEIRDGNSIPVRGRGGLFVRTTGFSDSGLSVVHEASSSSASEAGTMRSAYGSLREVLTKGNPQGDQSSDAKDTNPSSSWAIMKRGKESIVLVERPRSSRHISTDPIIERSQNGDQTLEPLSSFSRAQNMSWIPWRRISVTTISSGIERPTAASALKTLLGESQPALDLS